MLLPLALVGTLPAAVAAGVPVPPAAFVAVYDLLLPLGLVAASVSVLGRRPVSLPTPRVPGAHPGVPDRRGHALAGAAAAAAAGWALAPVLVGAWGRPILAVGAGAGTALVVLLHPYRAVRRRVRRRDRGLGDALAVLGRRVAGGQPVEAALPAVADRLSGPTGEAFAAAARRRRALGTSVRRAFVGPDGPFGPRRSVGPVAAAAVAAVGAAVSAGAPAGRRSSATPSGWTRWRPASGRRGANSGASRERSGTRRRCSARWSAARRSRSPAGSTASRDWARRELRRAERRRAAGPPRAPRRRCPCRSWGPRSACTCCRWPSC
ncbi:hypothetical protein ACFQRB_09515 [Halobaculum litoreum]|uniref:Type II secretion system protein GspF domain-containing protein n=1 Tax=Halobaculum litoreum TaxID=3031998 RepID=A0ABD5XS75_9EURY